jgi:hypothetical protein
MSNKEKLIIDEVVGRIEPNLPFVWKILEVVNDDEIRKEPFRLQLYEDETKLPFELVRGIQYELPIKTKHDKWGWTLDLDAILDGAVGEKMTEKSNMFETALAKKKSYDEGVSDAKEYTGEIVSEEALMLSPQHVMSFEESKIDFMDKWKMFNFIKNEIISDSDWHQIGSKKFLKKSGFRKLGQAFRLSTVIKETHLDRFEPPLPIKDKKHNSHDIYWQYRVKVRVTMPDNAFAEQWGIVSSFDNGLYYSPHDALGKATTRAISRAIADLVGYGISSNEDMV